MAGSRRTSLTWRRVVLALLAASLAVAVAWYAAADREVKTLDAAERERLGGTYVELTDGFTHYELAGREEGRVVVLVHGATVPGWDWDLQMGDLVAAGFRVLRYDQYGRGWSDRPRVEYNRDLYARQLGELLRALDIETTVDLVGHSLGGATAAAFTVRNPGLVNRLVLVSPVIDSVSDRTPFVVAGIPLVGRFATRVITLPTLASRSADQWRGTGDLAAEHARLFQEQMTYEGFEESLLSMFRSDAIGDYRGEYRTLADTGKKVMLVWGTRDRDIPRAQVDFVADAVPGIDLRVIDGAGHAPNVEDADRFNNLLIGFLGKGPS
jgi:pimeloyl-ACP methyl ester carboxylesterase